MSDAKRVLDLVQEMSISFMFNKIWEQYKEGYLKKKDILLAIEIMLDMEENPREKFNQSRRGEY